MLNWNTISSWTTKAGDISSKVKGFAKDLMTVDEEPLQTSNEKSQSPRMNPDVANFNQDSPSNRESQELKGMFRSEIHQKENEMKPPPTAESQCPQEQIPLYLEQLQKICKQEILKTFDCTEFTNFLQESFDQVKAAASNQQLDQLESFKQLIQDQAIKNFHFITVAQKQSINLINDILTQIQIEFAHLCQITTKEASEIKQQTVEQKLIQNYRIFVTELVQQLKSHFKVILKLPGEFELAEDLKLLSNIINKNLVQCQQVYQQQQKSSRLSESNLKHQESNSNLMKREQQLQTDNINLQKRLVDLQDKLTAFQMDNQVKDKRVKELEKYLGDFDKNKREFLDELKQKNCESESLRLKLKQRDQEISSLQLAIKEVGIELKSMNEMRSELDQKDEECRKLSSQLEEQYIETQALQEALNNRDKFHEQEILKQNDLIRKYELERKRFLSEIEQQQRSTIESTERQELHEKLRKQDQFYQRVLSDLEGKLVILKQEKEEMGLEIALLQKKLKTDLMYQNNLVDRRVVSKFLVNYFDASTEFMVKMQILETLSSILAFSDADREKIGLYKINKCQSDKQSTSPKTLSPNSSFKDKFIGFLMNDDE